MNQASVSRSKTAGRQLGRALAVGLLILALGGLALFAYLRSSGEAPKSRAVAPVSVVGAGVTTADLPVRLGANGTVSAVQSVEVRAQISATVRAVHVREGQFVRAGQPLFSLDVRTEEANIGKAEAQVQKSRADLANAERNLQRQRDLHAQKFISPTALDTAISQVDSLRAQLAADQASVASGRVALGFGEVLAPIAGRLGAITVYPGSLVQPSGAPLVSISQIDPINVSFSLPENELPSLQKSFAEGEVPVSVLLDGAEGKPRLGRLGFIDNSVDAASGTIRVKAVFANGDGRLWPGMFVKVALSTRTVTGALVVPVQAVQTGPERKFVYAIGEDGKVGALPVVVRLVQDGRAVIEGVAAGTRVVVEGAQNLRPGSAVVEAANAAPAAGAPPDPAAKSEKTVAAGQAKAPGKP